MKLAAAMKHSPIMSTQYVRKFSVKAENNEVKLDKIEKTSDEELEVLGLRRSARVKAKKATN